MDRGQAGVAPGRRVVLVVVGPGGDALGAAASLLGHARHLGEAHVAWFAGDAAAHAAELGRYGASVVHEVPAPDDRGVDDRGVDDPVHDPAVCAEVLAGLVATTGATTVVLPAEPGPDEVAALTAHRLRAGLVLGATATEVGAGDRVTVTRRALRGTWTVRAEVTTALAVVTVDVRAQPATPVPRPEAATVRRLEPAAAAPTTARRVVERTTGPTSPASPEPALADAPVVVVGGRGTRGDFGVLAELAHVLGGAVGATGVAVAEGWADPEMLVGQSGVTVSPRVYIGAGVSGAVHHRFGMEGSGTVVAVNEDPGAPIFDIADVGVVGDLARVLPQLTAELRRLRPRGVVGRG